MSNQWRCTGNFSPTPSRPLWVDDPAYSVALTARLVWCDSRLLVLGHRRGFCSVIALHGKKLFYFAYSCLQYVWICGAFSVVAQPKRPLGRSQARLLAL